MTQRRFGLTGAILMLVPWPCGAALAQGAASPPDEGTTASDAFSKGRLAPQLEKQVWQIVLEQIKAALPPAEEGSVSASKLEKGTAVSATVAGEQYLGSVYRTFLVEEMRQENLAVKEFYIRTTAPWKLKGGVVAPAETYFSLSGGRVMAFDAARIAAQDAAIAKSEALRKAALDQAERESKAKVADALQQYQAQMDKLTASVTQLTSDATNKQDARTAIIAKVNQQLQRRKPGQKPTTLSGNDSKGNLLWQYMGGQVVFFDNLDGTVQDLAAAREDQAALQAGTAAERTAITALFSRKTQALRAVATRERKRILGGEQIVDDDMRADYEAALGESLKAAPAPGSKPAASAQAK